MFHDAVHSRSHPNALIISTVDKRYRMLIDALDGTPRDVRRLLRPVSPAHAVQTLANGARLIDVVVRLVAYEPATRTNLERILAADHPTLVDAAPPSIDFDDVGLAIEAFTSERARTVALLETLAQAQWLRTASLAEHGPVRLRTLVERLVAHDNAQLAHIVDMRESVDRLR